MRPLLVLATLLACQSPSQATEPLPRAEVAPSPSPEPTMPDPRQIASTFATDRWPEAGDKLSLHAAGDATGFPAFVIRVGEPGQQPVEEEVVVVVDGQVWTGRSGWRQFLATQGRVDAYRVAAAWLALYRGEAQIPYGPDRKYKKKPMPAPRWVGDQLEVIYSGHRSQPMLVRLTIDASDTVTVVSEKPWTEPVEL